MPRQSVRTHQRRTKDGTTTVHQHHRTGRGKARRPSAARRGWTNLGRAFTYARRKKRTAAVFCAVLGTAQIGSFVALRGLSLAMVSVAVVATAVAGLAYAASSGGHLPERR